MCPCACVHVYVWVCLRLYGCMYVKYIATNRMLDGWCFIFSLPSYLCQKREKNQTHTERAREYWANEETSVSKYKTKQQNLTICNDYFVALFYVERCSCSLVDCFLLNVQYIYIYIFAHLINHIKKSSTNRIHSPELKVLVVLEFAVLRFGFLLFRKEFIWNKKKEFEFLTNSFKS